MNDLQAVENAHVRDDIPDFRAGDTVKVHVRVVEAGRERIQVFEGVVIARNGTGSRASFTVRKLSFGVGVERVFPALTTSPPLCHMSVSRLPTRADGMSPYWSTDPSGAVRVTELTAS